MEAPGSWPEPRDPWVAALCDVCLECQRHASPAQQRRLYEGNLRWLYGTAAEISYREQGCMPTLNEYAAIRLKTCGSPPVVALMDIVNDCQVTDEEWTSPQVRALHEIVQLLIGWDNDLYSAAKEHDLRLDRLNVLDILQEEQGISAEQAFTTAMAMRDRMMLRFLSLREEVSAHAGSALRHHVDALGYWLRGNIEYGLGSSRYTLTAGPARGNGSLKWRDSPMHGSGKPLPLPTIAWWWTV